MSWLKNLAVEVAIHRSKIIHVRGIDHPIHVFPNVLGINSDSVDIAITKNLRGSVINIPFTDIIMFGDDLDGEVCSSHWHQESGTLSETSVS